MKVQTTAESASEVEVSETGDVDTKAREQVCIQMNRSEQRAKINVNCSGNTLDRNQERGESFEQRIGGGLPLGTIVRLSNYDNPLPRREYLSEYRLELDRKRAVEGQPVARGARSIGRDSGLDRSLQGSNSLNRNLDGRVALQSE